MARLLVAFLGLAAGVSAEEDVVLRGRVTSAADGLPLAGATVTVRDWFDVVGERGVDREPPGPACVIETGPDGAFAVPAKGLKGPVIAVSAKGHATVMWREDEGASGIPRRDVALPEAGVLAGRVLDADGAPVPRARVFAVEWDALDFEALHDPLAAAADLLWGSGQYDEAIAYRYLAAAVGDDGAFRIADADPAKRYALVAASRKLGPSMLERRATPGAPLPALRLAATAAVRIRVVAETGEPVAVAGIKLRGSPREIAWRAAGEGVYEVGPVAPGLHVVELKTETRGEVRHEFTLPPGARDFGTSAIVAEGATVSGIVRDTLGHPVPRARVNLLVWDPDAGESRSCDVHTDTEGKFVAKGQPKGEVNLYVIAPGFQQAHFHELPQPVTGLAVTLRQGRDVTLDVSPPAGLRRIALLAAATRTLEDGGGPWVEDRYVSWDEEKVTITGVPVGRAAIRVWAPGAALYERELAIEAGADPLSLEPARLERPPTVTVRLVDEEGFPVPGLKVHAEFGDLPPVDWTAIQRTTDAKGLAVLDLHATGVVTVCVEEGQGRERVRRRIAIPADPKTVDVAAGERQE